MTGIELQDSVISFGILFLNSFTYVRIICNCAISS